MSAVSTNRKQYMARVTRTAPVNAAAIILPSTAIATHPRPNVKMAANVTLIECCAVSYYSGWSCWR